DLSDSYWTTPHTHLLFFPSFCGWRTNAAVCRGKGASAGDAGPRAQRPQPAEPARVGWWALKETRDLHEWVLSSERKLAGRILPDPPRSFSIEARCGRASSSGSVVEAEATVLRARLGIIADAQFHALVARVDKYKPVFFPVVLDCL